MTPWIKLPRKNQKIWFVPNDPLFGVPRELTVVFVGRSFAKLDNCYRLMFETWTIHGEGYKSPGKCYASKDEWSEQQERNLAWAELRFFINKDVPYGMKTSEIRSITNIFRAAHAAVATAPLE